MLYKYKENTDRKLAPVYFYSVTKTVIGNRYSVDKFIQEVFNRIDN